MHYGTVTNCIITRNSSFVGYVGSDFYRAGGGGIFMGLNTANSGGVWNCTISGNNVNSAAGIGGGIEIYRGGPWRIANCTISGNSGGIESGGIGAYATTIPTIISNCWAVSNYVVAGCAGGIYMASGVECYNSFIIGNTCDLANWSEGGGVRLQGGGLIRNCLIANNIVKNGGGGVATYNIASIQNCTIVSNYSVTSAGGLYVARTNVAAKVENTIIWGNSAGGTSSNWFIDVNVGAVSTFTNCCTSPNIFNAYGNASDVNTITNDPRLISTTDFRLQSGSSCINAGVNRNWMEGGWDVYGNRRIDNFRKTVDIGAYEYLSPGTVFGFQ
ncbi:MAG: hypothetical protein NT011_00895 [Kiritimatiellaeota bacterium]|nr:hypothetical protein [Kiritimatiellota bacterium]